MALPDSCGMAQLSAGYQARTLSPFYPGNEFSSLTVGLLYSILALNTVARVLLINCKVHHATFLLRTLQKLPDSLVIKAKALSRAGTRVR